MKIIIASDSYKGSCSTLGVADAMEKGIKKVYNDATIVKIPIADGGEGTVDALVSGLGGQFKYVEVIGPTGRKVNAKYGILEGNIAVIEMAQASGLTLIKKEERNPLLTTTYGTGQLIQDAIDEGCKEILIGIGGSATNDGGLGMAQALGVSFKDKEGKELGFGGGVLSNLEEIDISGVNTKIYETEIKVLCDVSNVLCGPSGASFVYGPQKGADGNMIKVLDNNLTHFAKLINRDLGKNVSSIPGSGAAGGLGAGLIAFCNASISSGIETLLDITSIEDHLLSADLVITGEGQIDGQSIYGKAPVGIAQRAKKYNVPVFAIVGCVGEGGLSVYSHGIDMVLDIINRPMSLDDAMRKVKELIEDTAENAMKIYQCICSRKDEK